MLHKEEAKQELRGFCLKPLFKINFKANLQVTNTLYAFTKTIYGKLPNFARQQALLTSCGLTNCNDLLFLAKSDQNYLSLKTLDMHLLRGRFVYTEKVINCMGNKNIYNFRKDNPSDPV